MRKLCAISTTTVDGGLIESEIFCWPNSSFEIFYMKIGSIIHVASIATLASAKSWLDQVGLSGSARYSGDTYSRQVCPPGAGAFCIGSTRPCASGVISNPKASMFSNEALYLHWNMNGLSASVTAGTCVKVGLASYASDPEWTSFKTMSDCLPFTHGTGSFQTDSYVMLPDDVKAGEYTVLWLWNSTGLTYASCADVSISTLPAPNPNQNPNPLSDTLDCKEGRPDPDTYCRSKFGFKSYCRAQENDACGNSYCYGEDAPVDCLAGIFAAGRRLEQIPTDDGTSLFRKIYNFRGCGILGSDFCESEFGEGSICIEADVDACGRSLCLGDTNPCV